MNGFDVKGNVLILCVLIVGGRLLASPCAPSIEWQQSYGGWGGDWLPQVVVLRDGGFLFTAISFSEPSGNKSAPSHGNGDIWLVRTDAYGTKLWDRSYGGTDLDNIFGVLDTTNGFRIAGAFAGGYVMGGFWLADLDGAGNAMSERFWHFRLEPVINLF